MNKVLRPPLQVMQTVLNFLKVQLPMFFVFSATLLVYVVLTTLRWLTSVLPLPTRMRKKLQALLELAKER